MRIRTVVGCAGTADEWPIDELLAEFIATELGDLIESLGETGGYAAPRQRAGNRDSYAQIVLRLAGR